MRTTRRTIERAIAKLLILLAFSSATVQFYLGSSSLPRLRAHVNQNKQMPATTTDEDSFATIGGASLRAEDMAGNDSFPVVDAVFMYVNGTEPHFRAQLANHRTGVESPEEERYRDVGQLRYGLRSVLQHAPWIRKIYVVVSDRKRQVPSWLDASHPRIEIVEHRDIWEDPSKLPTFSSPHIQWNLHRIPGLAPTFLYFDDDIQLTMPLVPDRDLWTSREKKYVLYESWEAPTRGQFLWKMNDKYGRSIAHVGSLYDHRYGRRTKRRVPAHAPILINTTIVGMIREEWKSQFDRMYDKSMFRNNNDMQFQFSYQQYIHSKKNATKVRLFEYVVVGEEALHFEHITDDVVANDATFRKISEEPRQFLCLQDGMHNPMEDVFSGVTSFYEGLFSVKAPWEKGKQ